MEGYLDISVWVFMVWVFMVWVFMVWVFMVFRGFYRGGFIGIFDFIVRSYFTQTERYSLFKKTYSHFLKINLSKMCFLSKGICSIFIN